MFGVRKSGSALQIELSLDAFSDHNFWCGLSSDMEHGGVFIATHQPIRLGTIIELSVKLPGVDEPTLMSGVVRWVRQHVDGSDVPAGVGIKFGPLANDIRDLVHRFTGTVREPLLFELDEVPMRARQN